MRTFFQKVKRFVRNIFEKIWGAISKIGKTARNPGIFHIKKIFIFSNIF